MKPTFPMPTSLVSPIIAFTALTNLALGLPLMSDNFNDNVKDPAKWAADISFGSGGTLAEINSRLEYTSTTASGDHGGYRPCILNQATYDTDWELVMDVSNSLSWTSGTGFRDTGIGIEIFPPATFDQSFFTEMNSSRFGSSFSFHGFVSGQGEDEFGDFDQELVSPGVIGSIRIVFNSATKVISTYCDTDGSANGYLWMKATFNPGITYVPQFSSNLQGSGSSGWTAASSPETLESIDNTGENDSFGVSSPFSPPPVRPPALSTAFIPKANS